MINFHDEQQFRPGAITYFYESGKRNIEEAIGIISSGINDPGGKSYGIYQLASKVGTLENFIKFFNEKYEEYFNEKSYLNIFNNIGLATDEFDNKWQFLATHAAKAFAHIQHAYIAETHFYPLIQYLSEKNIPLDKITPAIQEALWSLGVQHRKARIILQLTLDELKTIDDELVFINCLYKHRVVYVQQLTSLNPQMKQNISSRYQKESAEIIETLIVRKNGIVLKAM